MTAQGGDILAWLDRAITKRERRASAAPEGPWWAMPSNRGPNKGPNIPPSLQDWKILGHGRSGNTRHQVAGPGYEGGGVFGEAAAQHIVLNDPAAVLRRCAADRKLLEEHAQGSLPNGIMLNECRVCGGMNEPWPCPTLLILAEGYGWTGGER